MSIQEIIDSGANVTIAVSVRDLKEFAENLINRAIEDISLEMAKANEEVYYTRDQVMSMLSISNSTLWRYTKQGYLTAVRVGGELRYRKSDIERVITDKQ